MNKKLIYSILSILVIPLVGFAANELTLQTSTLISVGSDTLTVAGDYTMDSVTLDTASFTVTLSPGGSLVITSSGRNRISASNSSGVMASTVCNSSVSQLQLNATQTSGAQTITITPSATLCTTGSSGGSTSGSTTTTTDTTTTTVVPTTTTTTTTAPAATVTTPAVTTSIVTIPAATVSTPSVPVAAVVSAWEFRTPLKLGSTETAVTELQKRLTAEGVYSGPITGYFGSLTLAAVKKYQEEQGIATAGQAGYGNVGPATRASLNASAVSSVSTSQTSSATIEALQTQLQALQAQLLMLLSQQLQLLQAGQ